MRSMFMLAAFAAVIGFTGCCGTGGSSKLGSGLGAGKAVVSSVGAEASSAAVDACSVCGPDSVVSISAPYACDGECGSVPMSAPSSCGCSSCDGGGDVEYAPAQSSGCSACDSASTGEARGLLTANRPKRRRGLAANKGMGLALKGKGKACAETRSLSPSAGSGYVVDEGIVTGESCDECSAGVEQTVAQMPDGFLFGSSSGGRRISSGIVSDIKEARGGCRGQGCASSYAGGCGKRGCGAGKLCGACSKLAKVTGVAHPYGGAIPHTNPAVGQQPQSGIAPQYAYPYYTTRGPRDFLRDNPPSIGY